MTQLTLRAAISDDASGINAIYNPFIRESAATFETVEYSEAERRCWLDDRLGDPRYPVIIGADADSRIVGFASASAFDPRAAYETSVKVSVFVAPEGQGKGLGGALYKALFEALAGADIHRAYALIVTPNPGSIALHEGFGFAHVATLGEVGRKFGRFRDVMWFEKRL